MKNYSLTYTGVIVFAVGYLFQLAGVPFVPQELESTIAFAVALVGALQALWGRYRMGDLKPLGGRK